MSDEKRISEREAVKREREAFDEGACWQRLFGSGDRTLANAAENQHKASEAGAKRYPLPKVTRPRVVRESWSKALGNRYEWTLQDGRLRFRCIADGGRWFLPDGVEGGVFEPTRDRVAIWADLLANPTELIEDDS